MADVVGNAKYTIIAELDDADFQKNIARGLERTRDEMGRFAKEYRTIGETVMADMSNIFASGTNAMATVFSREMRKAADQAGTGFVERLGAALASVPGAVGTALSTGLIASATRAMRTTGEAASEALAERIERAAPYWKRAFSSSFNASVDPAVAEMLSKTQKSVSQLGNTFDRAGVHIADSLGTGLAKAANVVVPKLMPAVEQAQQLLQTGLRKAGELGSKALEFATERIVPVLGNVASKAGDMLSRGLEVAATAAGKVLSSGMERASKLASDAAQLPFKSYFATGLKAALTVAVVAGGVALTAGAVKLGVQASQGLLNAMRAGASKLGQVLKSAFQAAGRGILSAAKSIGQGAAKALGDALNLGVKAVGTSVAAILGTSLSKGFGRLKAIDNAEASLRGFAKTAGHVPEIMEAANNAVVGTAFGLDQAATAAAQFAAANVPIQDMERHLTSLSKSAAGAGGDFEGMSDIFAKVAAKGNVTGEVLNQLTSRGVSGLSALADHFGLTTDEVQKMVSAGEVSFDDFSRAMDKAMGDVAIEQATTFEGLMANVGAAMGRMGAVAQKPFFDSFKAVLPGVMNLFDQFTNILRPFADIIADRIVPAAESLGEKLKAVDLSAPAAGADQLFGSLGALAPVLGGVAAAFAGPLLSSIPVVGSLFTGLTGPVGILGGALVALFAVKPDTLLTGFETILGALPGILNSIVSKVTEVIPKLAENFVANAPVLLSGFAEMFGQIASAMGSILPVLLPVAVEAIFVLVDGIIGALPMLISAGLDVLMSLAEGIIQALPVIVEQAPKIIENLLSAIVENLPTIITAGIDLILALLMGVAEAIPLLIDAVADLIPVIVEALLGALPVLVEGAVELFLGLVVGIAQAIPDIVEAIIGLAPVILDALMELVPALWEAGRNLIVGLGEGLMDNSGEILPFLDSIGEPFMEFWEGTLKPLFDALAEGWGELWSSIQEAWSVIGPPLIEGIAISWEILSEIFAGIWDTVKVVFETAWEAIKIVVETAINVVKGVIETATALIKGDWEGVWNGIKSIFSSIWEGIKSVATTLVNGTRSAIETAINGVKNTWNTVWNNIKTVFSNIWNSIVSAAKGFANSVRNTFNSVMNFIRGVPGKIVGFFANMGSLLISSGRSLIDGFKQGIMSAFESVKNAVSNGLSAVRSLFPFSPAKEGPFSGRGWVTYAGHSLGSEFLNSAVKALDEGKRGVSDELSEVANAFNSPTLFQPDGMVAIGVLMARALADGLREGQSDVERAAKALGDAVNSAMLPAGVSLGGAASTQRLSSLAPGVSDYMVKDAVPSHLASHSSSEDNSRHLTIEAGAIQVLGGADPKKTSLDVLDRIVEELGD